MTTSPITLLGFGVAGQLLLSHILDKVPTTSVAIIDADFCGGALAKDYGAVQSNTTIQQKAEALRRFHPAWNETAAALETYGPPEACLRVGDLAHEIHRTGSHLAKGCLHIQSTVTSISWDGEQRLWTLTLQSGSRHTTRLLCCATGMEPRHIDTGDLPSIPLRVALDAESIKRFVRPKQKVLLVGSAHSGTLVIKHCLEIPDVSIRCIHRGERPFRFARDGAYDGIKQESAHIADEILSGKYNNRITFISTNDTYNLISAARDSTWLINATGFTAVAPQIHVGGDTVKITPNPSTGTVAQFPTLFCFGACAPAETEIASKRYPDISVGSFVDQILQRLPALQVAIQDISAS